MALQAVRTAAIIPEQSLGIRIPAVAVHQNPIEADTVIAVLLDVMAVDTVVMAVGLTMAVMTAIRKAAASPKKSQGISLAKAVMDTPLRQRILQ